MHTFEIDLSGSGVGCRVVMDGQDITAGIAGIEIRATVDGPTHVTVEYPAARVLGNITTLGDEAMRRAVFRMDGPLHDSPVHQLAVQP